MRLSYGKILVTGGTGFIGKHLKAELERRGFQPIVFSSRQYDLTISDAAQAVFAAHRDVQIVLHMAS